MQMQMFYKRDLIVSANFSTLAPEKRSTTFLDFTKRKVGIEVISYFSAILPTLSISTYYYISLIKSYFQKN